MIIEKEKTGLIIFNMQLELIPLLHEGPKLVYDCRWLADVAKEVGVPTLIIEHKKLGNSSKTLKEVAQNATYLEKTYFNFLNNIEIQEKIDEMNCDSFLLAGAETHVCLLQSALGLKSHSKNVFLFEDVSSSRNLNDHVVALERIKNNGINLITKEMFFFEMIKHSEFPNYIDLAMKFLDGRYIK
jgi:nicotinamidase-related amidase